MDIRRDDHTGDRPAMPFDEEADLRTANASVPVIAYQSPFFPEFRKYIYTQGLEEIKPGSVGIIG